MIKGFRIPNRRTFGHFQLASKCKIKKLTHWVDDFPSIYKYGRKNIYEFSVQRLKKDMMHKVNIVASDFRKVSNKMMAETTKRTIRENVSINSQIQKMSDKSHELDSENEELRDQEIKRLQQIKQLQLKEKDLG